MFYLLYYTESLNKSFYSIPLLLSFYYNLFLNNNFICLVSEISQTLVGFFNSCINNAAKAMLFLNIQKLLIK